MITKADMKEQIYDYCMRDEQFAEKHFACSDAWKDAINDYMKRLSKKELDEIRKDIPTEWITKHVDNNDVIDTEIEADRKAEEVLVNNMEDGDGN